MSSLGKRTRSSRIPGTSMRRPVSPTSPRVVATRPSRKGVCYYPFPDGAMPEEIRRVTQENIRHYGVNDPRDIKEGDTVCIRAVHRPGAALNPERINQVARISILPSYHMLGSLSYDSGQYKYYSTRIDSYDSIGWEHVGIYVPRISKTAIRKVGMEKGLPDDIIEDMIRNYGGGFKAKKVKR
jgi:hypothetical protein